MRPDALIFDMDGTLWDAVDLYASAWTEVFKKKGINRIISRADLQKLMGLEVKPLLENAIPEIPENERIVFYQDVLKEYEIQLPLVGAIIYSGVVNGLQQLSQKYKLFILSNCDKGGIKLFLNYSKTESYISFYIEHGMNGMPKCHNIKLLIDQFHLKSPVYIGDTESDRKQCDIVNVPFFLVKYGFGTTDKYAAAFDHFSDMGAYFMAL